MYIIKLEKETVELKAKARFYREFKLRLGCANLKSAFFEAYENVDVDFLAKWIVAFNVDRTFTEEHAYDVLDTYLESDGNTLDKLFAECAEFLNGMGFFGKLELSEGESAIDYFADKSNKVNLDEKVAAALDNGLSNIVNEMVAERINKETKN